MVTVYTTCPDSHDCTGQEFRQRVTDAAKWAESLGCRGLLVYSDNTLVDPWATAELIIRETDRVVPMIAVNPVYMSPYSVARMISTIAFIHNRQVDLNYVIGGFDRHLIQLACRYDHDQRYDQLIEYVEIVNELLGRRTPVTYPGSYYQLDNALIAPPMMIDKTPRAFVSGTSDACKRAQKHLGLTRLHYPREPGSYSGALPLGGCGIRIGIIARETSAEAWAAAHERFPISSDGEAIHEYSVGRVQSQWHIDLSQDALSWHTFDGPYWLYPFRAYHTFCPYLVGDFDEVSSALARYVANGVSTIILDVVPDITDLQYAMATLASVLDR